jgi:NitT/TauT family transport system permease protein
MERREHLSGVSGDRKPRSRRLVGWVLVPVLLATVWQAWAASVDRPYLFPTFTSVMAVVLRPLEDHYRTGSLAAHAAISLVRVIMGFGAAALVAVPLGVLLGASARCRRAFEPLLEILRPLCPIAWLPFAIAVFKLQTVPETVGVPRTGTLLDHVYLSMLFVLFWGGFFPILVNTVDGVRGVRRNYVILASVLGAGRGQTFRHVLLPAAAPAILTGLRQGIGVCWFVIIAAEMLPGGNQGVGYLLMEAAARSDMALVVACMLVVGAIGAGLSALMRRLMLRAVSWQGREV